MNNTNVDSGTFVYTHSAKIHLNGIQGKRTGLISLRRSRCSLNGRRQLTVLFVTRSTHGQSDDIGCGAQHL